MTTIPKTSNYFFLPVQPVPASRPRVGRFGAYYGKNYEQFRVAAQPMANQADFSPTDKPVVVHMECVATKPKSGKLRYPRGDIDNYVKGPLDVMTKSGKFWIDDDQVVELHASKRYCREDEMPGIHIYFHNLEDKPYK